MQRWQQSIASGIREMQSAGDIAPVLEANRTASAILAGTQGVSSQR
jgi:hypothetical protein